MQRKGDVARNRNREALLKLLASSAASLSKFEAAQAELLRAASDAVVRSHAFEAQMEHKVGASAELRRMVEEARVVSKHTAADMQEAADEAYYTVEAHRAAHTGLEASLEGTASSTGEGGFNELRAQGRMPAHPTERVQEALEPSNAAAVLRDAIAECRKVLRQADQVFASARSRMAKVSSGMQAAVVATKRPSARNAARQPGQFLDVGGRDEWLSKQR